MDACALCKSKEKDDVRYGEFLKLKKEKLAVHVYCLYLTSNLCQNGDADSSEGFYGFMPKDIRREAMRISRLYCCYCLKNFSNIGCCETKCRRTFHLVCGIKNGAQNQFITTFKSFCDLHVRKVRHRPSKNEQCCICYDNLVAPNQRFCPVNMLRAPCCKNGWFHKFCLQNFAKSAGYFFKCPLCNDTDIVRNNLPYRGIFIPNSDAAWELEPNAFADLLERPNECTATLCKCRGGRTENTTQNALLRCNTCGSNAMHKACKPENIIKDKIYICNDCNLRHESFCEDDTDEEIDVCNDCDKPQTDKSIESENNVLMNLYKSQQKGQQIQDSDDESSTSEDETLLLNKRFKSKKISSNESDNEKSDDNKITTSKRESINHEGSDSDLDELENFRPINENVEVQKFTKNSNVENYDNESDDELEIFFECTLEKKRENNKICEKLKEQSKVSFTDDPNRDERPTTSTKSAQSTKNTKKPENIEKPDFPNISCIANRTRRKSICYSSDEIAKICKPISSDEEYFSETCSNAISTTSAKYKPNDKDEKLESIEKPATPNISLTENPTPTSEVANIYEDMHMPHETRSLANDKEYCSETSSNASTSSCISRRTRKRILYLSETSSNSGTMDISCIARRTRKRTSMHADEEYSPTAEEYVSKTSSNTSINVFADTKDISCIAKRTRKRSSIFASTVPEQSSTLSTSIGHQSTSWSSTQTLSTSNSYKSCLSMEVKPDCFPSISNSVSSNYSSFRRKVFVKKRKCSTITKPRRRLSSTEDDNYSITTKKNCQENIVQRNFFNENDKCPMRANNMYAYITPEFRRVDGKLKRGKPTYSSNANLLHHQHNNFKRSHDFLVGSEKK